MIYFSLYGGFLDNGSIKLIKQLSSSKYKNKIRELLINTIPTCKLDDKIKPEIIKLFWLTTSYSDSNSNSDSQKDVQLEVEDKIKLAKVLLDKFNDSYRVIDDVHMFKKLFTLFSVDTGIDLQDSIKGLLGIIFSAEEFKYDTHDFKHRIIRIQELNLCEELIKKMESGPHKRDIRRIFFKLVAIIGWETKGFVYPICDDEESNIKPKLMSILKDGTFFK